MNLNGQSFKLSFEDGGKTWEVFNNGEKGLLGVPTSDLVFTFTQQHDIENAYVLSFVQNNTKFLVNDDGNVGLCGNPTSSVVLFVSNLASNNAGGYTCSFYLNQNLQYFVGNSGKYGLYGVQVSTGVIPMSFTLTPA